MDGERACHGRRAHTHGERLGRDETDDWRRAARRLDRGGGAVDARRPQRQVRSIVWEPAMGGGERREGGAPGVGENDGEGVKTGERLVLILHLTTSI